MSTNPGRASMYAMLKGYMVDKTGTRGFEVECLSVDCKQCGLRAPSPPHLPLHMYGTRGGTSTAFPCPRLTLISPEMFRSFYECFCAFCIAQA